jgi:hypothetical protein
MHRRILPKKPGLPTGVVHDFISLVRWFVFLRCGHWEGTTIAILGLFLQFVYLHSAGWITPFDRCRKEARSLS